LGRTTKEKPLKQWLAAPSHRHQKREEYSPYFSTISYSLQTLTSSRSDATTLAGLERVLGSLNLFLRLLGNPEAAGASLLSSIAN
jgi:hypothetical protein